MARLNWTLSRGDFRAAARGVKLQDLPLRLLVLLVERPGEIVTREELRQRLWPEDTFVEFDNSLGVAVRKLREALRDDADAPRYVETVPRRGYRFVAPVTVQDAADADLAAEGTKEASASSVNRAGRVAQAEIENQLLVSSSRFSAGAEKAARTASLRSRYWIIACLVLVMVGIAIYEFRSNPRPSAAGVETVAATSRVRPRRGGGGAGLPQPGGASGRQLAFDRVCRNAEHGAGGWAVCCGWCRERTWRAPNANCPWPTKTLWPRPRWNGCAKTRARTWWCWAPTRCCRAKMKIASGWTFELQDTAGGETIAEQALTGSEDKLFELAAQAGAELRQSLGVNSVSAEAISAARASLPSNQEAVRLYAEGRAKLWAFDFQGARDLLVKAVAADPNYPLAHSALSEAWWHMGYESKARAEAQQALNLSKHLPQEEQLLVEGQYRRAIEDWPKTVQAYQTLFHLFPDRLDYGLLLASAQMYITPGDSLQTLAGLRRLPPPAGDDARIDMMEASALIGTDFTKARSAAQRAIDKASAQGSHVLVARTYGILCQQGPAIEASADTIRECQIALQSSMAAGDMNGEAMMLTDLAGIYYQQGDLARAEKMWRQAIQEFRQVGNPDGVATALS